VRVADRHPYYDGGNHARTAQQQNPINTMVTLADEAGADKNWHYLGWMGVIAGFLILSITASSQAGLRLMC